MFQPADPVRHRNKPEWGLGRIVGETGEGKVLVKFAARARATMLLAADFAEKFLVPDDGVIAAPIGQRSTGGRHPAAAQADSEDAVRREELRGRHQRGADVERRSSGARARHARRAEDVIDVPAVPGVVRRDRSAARGRRVAHGSTHGWCNACRAGGRAERVQDLLQVR
ncbi:MAG: DUF3553 domain-containing protein [Vicinamibacterales bacterium]